MAGTRLLASRGLPPALGRAQRGLAARVVAKAEGGGGKGGKNSKGKKEEGGAQAAPGGKSSLHAWAGQAGGGPVKSQVAACGWRERLRTAAAAAAPLTHANACRAATHHALARRPLHSDRARAGDGVQHARQQHRAGAGDPGLLG